MRIALEVPAATEADEELHRLLLRLACNPQAAQLVDRLRTTTSFPSAVAAPARRSGTQPAGEHDALVRAVLARDAEGAAAMRAHLAGTADLLVAQALRARGTAEEGLPALAGRVWSAAVAGY